AVRLLGERPPVKARGVKMPDPLIDRGEIWHLHAARLHGRTHSEKSDRFRQGRETVRAAVLRVEVHELPDFTGVLAGSLKIEMLDEHRRETLLMLDFHAVENAAVGVNADKEFFRGFEIAQYLCRVAHNWQAN